MLVVFSLTHTNQPRIFVSLHSRATSDGLPSTLLSYLLEKIEASSQVHVLFLIPSCLLPIASDIQIYPNLISSWLT